MIAVAVAAEVVNWGRQSGSAGHFAQAVAEHSRDLSFKPLWPPPT
ncbi:hypothetical protein [Fertoeibacter niger]|nr:hypothetical protein [Fertoeibacter niger]